MHPHASANVIWYHQNQRGILGQKTTASKAKPRLAKNKNQWHMLFDRILKTHLAKVCKNTLHTCACFFPTAGQLQAKLSKLNWEWSSRVVLPSESLPKPVSIHRAITAITAIKPPKCTKFTLAMREVPRAEKCESSASQRIDKQLGQLGQTSYQYIYIHINQYV